MLHFLNHSISILRQEKPNQGTLLLYILNNKFMHISGCFAVLIIYGLNS